MQRMEPDAEVFDLVSDDDEEGSSLMESYMIEPFSGKIVHRCVQCSLSLKPKYSVTSNSIMYYICNDQCLMTFETEKRIASSSMGVRNLQIVDINAAAKIKFKRSCGECTKDVSDLETILSWETMEFCNEQCLGKYQWDNLSNCTSCGNEVGFAHLGKYSVRFGHDIRQFCNKVCLQKFKDTLKMCSSCHKDISGSDDRCATSFGAKKQFKSFCTGKCLLKSVIAYDKQLNRKPRVCVLCEKKTDTPIAMEHGGLTKLFCDRSCFGDFKLIYGIVTGPILFNLFQSLKPKYSVTKYNIIYYICNDQCLMTFETEKRIASSSMGVRNLQIVDINTAAKIKFKRSCGECTKDVSDLRTILSWETMEFCNEQCLGKYQWDNLSNCTSCGNEVGFAHLGKYSVRFGHDIRQFCNKVCLQKFKDTLKMCSSCHKDISGSDDRCATSFGARKQFKSFCTGKCLLKYVIAYDKQLNSKRRVCVLCEKKTNTPIAMEHGGLTKLFCDRSCFGDFKLIYGIVTDECGFCKKYVDTKTLMKYSMYFGDAHHAFCSERCKNIYLIAERKQISCNQCEMSKFTFDMIQWDMYHGGQLTVCSLYCFKLYYGTQHIGRCPRQCSYCQKSLQEGSHGMDDTTVAVFCSAPCLTAFQKQCEMILVPPDMPSTSRQTSEQPKKSDPTGLETSTFANLKSSVRSTMCATKNSNVQNKHPQKVKVSNKTVPSQRNVGTMCEVTGQDKNVHIKPTVVTKGIQTDKKNPIILPIPFPIGVPLPMLGGLPIPLPLPCPIPIPVPIFILTTCETVPEIMKKIQDTREKVPTDPLEAELIMMANMVADKASVVVNLLPASETNLAPELDDVPQEKSGICEIPRDAIQDWEDAISPSIIIVTRGDEKESSRITDSHQQDSRSSNCAGNSPNCSTKKQKLEYVHEAGADLSSFQPPECELTEKIEANMSLNYQTGLHAWNNWVLTRSATTENSSAAAPSFNTEILHHTVDELSYGLCLFVKEIREPNGQPYAPDIIYYFCLCIQTYLLKNDRTENIFFDSSYKKFTECLDELAQQFLATCNDSSYIVTHVREEYLWESHQLGAHSPYVLLYTIMYFNTKLFNLETIKDHRQLSFLKVMELWENYKESGRSKLPVQKRFNNTSSLSQEQEFIRSPEQLYKFYLTKCPERLKKQDGAFYLLPASDCSPDSPAWFSSRALPQNDFKKMFNRIKFVKEIHLALL